MLDGTRRAIDAAKSDKETRADFIRRAIVREKSATCALS
jgi:hypothetical protein